MAEPIPEVLGERTPERRHAAVLRFVPNQVLFEGLRRFYRMPELKQRLGQGGLFLTSVKSMPVVHAPYRAGFEPGPGRIAMSDIDRIDHDLRQLGHNDGHMGMDDYLGFTPVGKKGIAIHMAVNLNQATLDRLQGTPFIAEDGRSVEVRLRLVDGEHAGGSAMGQAARGLQSILESDYPRPGVEGVELTIR